MPNIWQVSKYGAQKFAFNVFSLQAKTGTAENTHTHTPKHRFLQESARMQSSLEHSRFLQPDQLHVGHSARHVLFGSRQMVGQFWDFAWSFGASHSWSIVPSLSCKGVALVNQLDDEEEA